MFDDCSIRVQLADTYLGTCEKPTEAARHRCS